LVISLAVCHAGTVPDEKPEPEKPEIDSLAPVVREKRTLGLLTVGAQVTINSTLLLLHLRLLKNFLFLLFSAHYLALCW
jgi:hypothetical protein